MYDSHIREELVKVMSLRLMDGIKMSFHQIAEIAGKLDVTIKSLRARSNRSDGSSVRRRSLPDKNIIISEEIDNVESHSKTNYEKRKYFNYRHSQHCNSRTRPDNSNHNSFRKIIISKRTTRLRTRILHNRTRHPKLNKANMALTVQPTGKMQNNNLILFALLKAKRKKSITLNKVTVPKPLQEVHQGL